jgi:glycosyltransferase involved in cell wall biosynthesis
LDAAIRPGPDERVRVLRLFSRLNIGGPSIHVILLTAGLASYGYETRLLVGQETEREGDFHDLARDSGVTCIRVAGLGREVRLLSDLFVLGRLYRAIREFRPTIVHTHTAKAGFVGRVAAWMAGVPVVVHTFHGHVLRGYFGPAKTAFYRLLERWLAAGSHALIAVSESIKGDLVALKVAPPEKIRVIELGLPLEELSGELLRGRLRGEAAIPEAAPLIGIVGRLVPIKDVGVFLEAARRVHETHPDAHFAVVGDGDERPALERHAAELGLEGRLHFFGWRLDRSAVYGDLDVVVNCSRNEGTPVALIEALAAGRPVVATRVGGTPDLLGDGARGMLVPPADPEALAGAIRSVLDAPGAARTVARVGQEYVLRRHSTARLLRDVDALYRDLLRAGVPA